jgi:hypothetical protein
MYVHTPSRYDGPKTHRRAWWKPSATKPRVRRRGRAADAPIRQELVDRVRREIAAGTYDTPEKLEVALERMLDQFSR